MEVFTSKSARNRKNRLSLVDINQNQGLYKNLFKVIIPITVILCIHSCRKNYETGNIPVESVNADSVVYSINDTINPGRVMDMKYFDSYYYILGYEGTLFKLDKNFQLVNSRSFRGRGPGESMEVTGLFIDETGLYVFNNTNLNILLFSFDLDYIQSIATENLFTGFKGSIVKVDSFFLSGMNVTNELVSVISIDSTNQALRIPYNFGSMVELRDDEYDFIQPNHFHNQYLIDYDPENELVILVSSTQPHVFFIDSKSGQLLFRYSFENIEYLKHTLLQNDEFHRASSSKMATSTLVNTMFINEGKLYLQFITRTATDNYSNTLVEFNYDRESKSVAPEQIYQLNGNDEVDLPWVDAMLFDGEVMIVFDAKDFEYYFYTFTE